MFSYAAHLLPSTALCVGQWTQIQSITDVSRGSIRRKKMSGADAPSIPEDEVAVATKQLMDANHTDPTIDHVTPTDIINIHNTTRNAVIRSWRDMISSPSVLQSSIYPGRNHILPLEGDIFLNDCPQTRSRLGGLGSFQSTREFFFGPAYHHHANLPQS